MNATKLLGLILASIFAQRFVDWPFLPALVYALTGLLIASFIWSRLSLRKITVERRLEPDRLQVGQTVRDHLVVSNTRPYAALWLEVLDYSTLPTHAASRVVHVGAKKQQTWTQATACMKRGLYRTGPIVLHSGDPFGLFPVKRRLPLTQEILVYPGMFDLSGYLLPGGQIMGQSARAQRTPFVDSSVSGVRDYVQGDGLNRISWSTSARLGRLMVKEFDFDPASDLWLVLDLQRAHQRRASPDHPLSGRRRTPLWLDSTEEYVISVGASIARKALNDSRSVGVILSSSRTTVLMPDRTERQLRRVLEQLAIEHADGSRSLHEILLSESHRFRRQSSVVVVTASPEPGWTTALGEVAGRRIPCGAVVVDSGSFGDVATSADSVARLLAHGIPVHRLGYGDDISSSLVARRSASFAGPAVVEHARSG